MADNPNAEKVRVDPSVMHDMTWQGVRDEILKADTEEKATKLMELWRESHNTVRRFDLDEMQLVVDKYMGRFKKSSPAGVVLRRFRADVTAAIEARKNYAQ